MISLASDPHRPSGDAPAPPEEEVIYVYAFVDASGVAHLPDLPELAGPLRLHRVGSLGAVFRRVPAADFCGPDGERNLTDAAWIMPRVCQHEVVVEAAMLWSPVFPTRFATLYNSLSSLSDFMRRYEPLITSFLRQVTGQQEWALKVTADLDDLPTLDELAVQLWPDWSGYPPGRRYLRLRQERPVLLAAAHERVARLVPGILDGLRALVSSVRPLERASSSAGGGARFVADFALLASGGRRAALDHRLGELASDPAHRRVRLSLTGPWPPYSFRPVLDGNASPRGR